MTTPTIHSPPSRDQARGSFDRAWELLGCLRVRHLRRGYAIVGALREGDNTDELTPDLDAAGIYIIGRGDGISDSLVGELGGTEGSSTREGRTVSNLEGLGEGNSVGRLEGFEEGRSGEGCSMGNLEGTCSREEGRSGEGISGVIGASGHAPPIQDSR